MQWLNFILYYPNTLCAKYDIKTLAIKSSRGVLVFIATLGTSSTITMENFLVTTNPFSLHALSYQLVRKSCYSC